VRDGLPRRTKLQRRMERRVFRRLNVRYVARNNCWERGGKCQRERVEGCLFAHSVLCDVVVHFPPSLAFLRDRNTEHVHGSRWMGTYKGGGNQEGTAVKMTCPEGLRYSRIEFGGGVTGVGKAGRQMKTGRERHPAQDGGSGVGGEEKPTQKAERDESIS
ncbi:unnamed protein product, partial [Ectocarpus sp. 12 AP-2014]